MVLRKPAFKSRNRHGGMIIEVVVASVLFATALVALGRLAHTSTSLNVQSDQRLSAKLTAENAIVRLNAVDFDVLEAKRESVQKQLSESSGMIVQIDSMAFSIQERDAMKLTVQVSDESTAVNVTLHDWIVQPQQASDQQASDQEDEAGNDE